jgi:hypothetical protein
MGISLPSWFPDKTFNETCIAVPFVYLKPLLRAPRHRGAFSTGTQQPTRWPHAGSRIEFNRMIQNYGFKTTDSNLRRKPDEALASQSLPRQDGQTNMLHSRLSAGI